MLQPEMGVFRPLNRVSHKKVVFRNIINRYFYRFCVVNPIINGVLSQSYITWYRAIWARGRVGKRPRWVDFSRRDFNARIVCFKRCSSGSELALICCRLWCVSWRRTRCVARGLHVHQSVLFGSLLDWNMDSAICYFSLSLSLNFVYIFR